MIPAPTTIETFDDLPGEEIEFGIGDPRWVMRNNAELYSDISTAIIREYSTNAYDANVMAGHRDPIEVTLPSVFGDKYFIVKDTGVGMNKQIFKEIYTQFGISDKRDLKDANGLMGYGSKSGVAYTNQFSVTSVRDGIRTEGVVIRKDDWSIVLKVVREVVTDEPNGTVIKIPVHNVEEFNHKAMEFYKFWLPGRVLVNGAPIEHSVGKKIADNLYYSANWNTSYVVMANVPYRINNPAALFYNSKLNAMNFVAYVDDLTTVDGAQPVEFTPSREDLKYTQRTKDTLQAIIHQFEKDLIAKAKAEIAKATTHAEAWAAWHEWTTALGSQLFDRLEFKGDKFTPDFSVSGHRYEINGYRGSAYAISKWHVESMPRTLMVTEFGITMSSNAKRQAREYAKLQGWDIKYVVFTPKAESDIDCPWISRDQFVTWDDLKAALPKQPRKAVVNSNNPNAGRVTGSWDYHTRDESKYEQPLPATGDVYWISVHRNKSIGVRTVLQYLNDATSVVLVVPANRLPKLLRENPKVKNFEDYAKSKIVKDGASLLSQEAKDVLTLSRDTRSWLNALDMTQVDDPELHRLRNLIKDESALLKSYRHNDALAKSVGLWYHVTEYKPTVNGYLYETYPLMTQFSYYRFDKDIYVYLNAKFAANSAS